MGHGVAIYLGQWETQNRGNMEKSYKEYKSRTERQRWEDVEQLKKSH